MPLNVITVRPERSRLVAFARWATAQTPKIGTVGLGEFGVPADLFVQAPEEILVGALVDGHRYVSPEEDAANGVPEPGDHQDEVGQELLGVATPEALTPAAAAVAGDDSDPSDQGPDFTPLEDAPSDEEGGPFACDQCPREFTTERGRDSHRRQVHRED